MAKLTTETRTDIYQTVTNAIIAQLEAGTRPWAQPWKGGSNPRPLRHNGVPYSGINTLLLWIEAQARGFSSNYWMTYRQAQELGAQVRKGERSCVVVYAGAIERNEVNNDGEEVETRIPFLKTYNVFNADQIDGLPEHYTAAPAAYVEPAGRYEAADAFVANTGAIVRHGGSRAFYSLATDAIQMPPFEAFHDAESYATTLLHELVHWSGAKPRLRRAFEAKRWGDAIYAAGGNGGTSTAYTCQVHPVCSGTYTQPCQTGPSPVVAGGGGGAAGGPKGRGGDGSGTGIANLGQNGAGAGGTIGAPQTSGGVYSCSRTCLAGSSTGLQSKYGQTVPGEAPGTVFGHSFGYYFDGRTGNNIKTKRYNLEGNCGDGADEDYFFGGGGGAAPGVVAVKQANGKYVLTQTPGLGGGGGELSYGTYAVTPGSKLTVVVGAGGGLDDRNAVKKNSFDSAWRNNTLDAYISGTSEIGDGDNGGVWIIWGPGRSFPDNVNVP